MADVVVVFFAALLADLLLLAIVAAVGKWIVAPRLKQVALNAMPGGGAPGFSESGDIADLLAEGEGEPAVEVGTGDVQDQLHDEEGRAPRPGVSYERE